MSSLSIKKGAFWIWLWPIFVSAAVAQPLVPWEKLTQTQDLELTKVLMDQIQADPELGNLWNQGNLSIGVIDLSRHGQPRAAMLREDQEYYVASLAKLALILTNYHMQSLVPKDPLTAKLVLPSIEYVQYESAHYSDNGASSILYSLLGQKKIAETLEHYGFASPGKPTGLWMGASYATPKALKEEVDFLVLDKKFDRKVFDGLEDRSAVVQSPPSGSGFIHGATLAGLLRYFYLMANDALISRQGSRWLLSVLKEGVTAWGNVTLESNQGINYFTKVGYVSGWMSEVTLVEGKGFRFILSLMTHYTPEIGQDPFAKMFARFEKVMGGVFRYQSGKVSAPVKEFYRQVEHWLHDLELVSSNKHGRTHGKLYALIGKREEFNEWIAACKIHSPIYRVVSADCSKAQNQIRDWAKAYQQSWLPYLQRKQEILNQSKLLNATHAEFKAELQDQLLGFEILSSFNAERKLQECDRGKSLYDPMVWLDCVRAKLPDADWVRSRLQRRIRGAETFYDEKSLESLFLKIRPY